MVITISVDGLWRATVDVPEDTTWSHLQEVIYRETGVFKDYQRISSPSRPDVFYDGPLHFEEGDEVAFEWQFPRGEHPLHGAARLGSPEVVRRWVASGASVDVTDDEGITPLMSAVSGYPCHGQTEVVAELLRLGADVRMRNRWEGSALDAAATSLTSVEVVALLADNMVMQGVEAREVLQSIYDRVREVRMVMAYHLEMIKDTDPTRYSNREKILRYCRRFAENHDLMDFYHRLPLPERGVDPYRADLLGADLLGAGGAAAAVEERGWPEELVEEVDAAEVELRPLAVPEGVALPGGWPMPMVRVRRWVAVPAAAAAAEGEVPAAAAAAAEAEEAPAPIAPPAP